jgi:hypothetical protein
VNVWIDLDDAAIADMCCVTAAMRQAPPEDSTQCAGQSVCRMCALVDQLTLDQFIIVDESNGSAQPLDMRVRRVVKRRRSRCAIVSVVNPCSRRSGIKQTSDTNECFPPVTDR